MRIVSALRSFLDGRHYISARVFWYIFIATLVVSLVLLTAYSVNAIREMTALSIQNGQNAVDTITQQLNSMITELAQTHTLYYSSEFTRRFLGGSRESMPSYEWFQHYADAKRMLQFCLQSKYSVISGMLLQKSSGETISYGSFSTQLDLESQRGMNFYHLTVYRNHAFYSTALAMGEGNMIYLSSQIHDALFDSLCQGLLTEDSALLLLDSQGNAFRQYESGPDAQKQLERYLRGDSGLNYVKGEIAGGDLTVVMLFPGTTIGQLLSQMAPWLLTLGLLALLSGALMSIAFSRSVSFSISTLRQNIELVEKQDYAAVSVIHSEDEFGVLSRTFAEMAAHIEALIRENHEREQLQHELEIQMLRAQISPHFLYNALGSVRQLAAIQGMRSVEKLTLSLIRLLKAALSSADSLVPLRQELEYVRSYCEICQYQYLNDFKITYQMDEELMDCLTPTMILQPIVENAIIHGIADRLNDGEILVRGEKKGEDMLLSILDNGQGMTPKQIESLLRQESNTSHQRFSGIGIYNIRKRIELRFGPPYGLSIDSQPGRSTAIFLFLPCIKEQKEQNHETNSAGG